MRLKVSAHRQRREFAATRQCHWQEQLISQIFAQLVIDEIARLKEHWVEPSSDILSSLLPTAVLEEVDAFDRLQLESVVAVCRRSRSLADAGRALFGASRSWRRTINDSDRPRKYLARFGLEWVGLVGREE